MFKDNKYTKWYFRIIDNARDRLNNDYTETHHIIPRCLGGGDDKENLIKLTAKEHFICHILLTKMNENHKLKYALVNMSLINHKQLNKRYVPNSNTYEYIRRMHSIAATERMNEYYKNNPGYNKGKKLYYNISTLEHRYFDKDDIIDLELWAPGMSPKTRKVFNGMHKGRIYYHNPKTNEVRALHKDDDVPDGWIKGNPNADTSDFAKIRGSAYYYDPDTGIEDRINLDIEEIPNGWVKGRPIIWITNGIDNKQINIVTDKIPNGWKRGRNINKDPGHKHRIRNSMNKKVMTPFGIYNHPLDFCEEWGINEAGFFDNIDTKIRKMKGRESLFKKLIEMGLNIDLTKRELGFYKIDW